MTAAVRRLALCLAVMTLLPAQTTYKWQAYSGLNLAAATAPEPASTAETEIVVGAAPFAGVVPSRFALSQATEVSPSQSIMFDAVSTTELLVYETGPYRVEFGFWRTTAGKKLLIRVQPSAADPSNPT